MADLIERLDLRGARRALGHDERPDRLHVAVAALARSLGSARQRGAGRLDGVGRVRLTRPPASLAVRSVDLDHFHSGAAQEPGETRPVRAGPLHADASQVAKTRQEPGELAVARASCRELRNAEQASDPVERRRHVHIEVRVHTARHRARRIYSGHRHPFSLNW
jgi:hypothetical protein